MAEEDWHMPIESFQYLIICIFRVNTNFIFNILLSNEHLYMCVLLKRLVEN